MKIITRSAWIEGIGIVMLIEEVGGCITLNTPQVIKNLKKGSSEYKSWKKGIINSKRYFLEIKKDERKTFKSRK